jgi:hypothetical protein
LSLQVSETYVHVCRPRRVPLFRQRAAKNSNIAKIEFLVVTC